MPIEERRRTSPDGAALADVVDIRLWVRVFKSLAAVVAPRGWAQLAVVAELLLLAKGSRTLDTEAPRTGWIPAALLLSLACCLGHFQFALFTQSNTQIL